MSRLRRHLLVPEKPARKALQHMCDITEAGYLPLSPPPAWAAPYRRDVAASLRSSKGERCQAGDTNRRPTQERPDHRSGLRLWYQDRLNKGTLREDETPLPPGDNGLLYHVVFPEMGDLLVSHPRVDTEAFATDQEATVEAESLVVGRLMPRVNRDK